MAARPKKPKKLNAREHLFKSAYLIDPNALQAALTAGYAETTANAKAPLWVGKERTACPVNKRHLWDAVQEAMSKRSERTEVTVDRVLLELSRIAFANSDEFYEWANDTEFGGTDGCKLIGSKLLTRDQTAAVAGVVQKKGQFGNTVEVKLYDKQKALEMIARHLGMFNDGLNLNIQGLGDMILDARKRRRQEGAGDGAGEDA